VNTDARIEVLARMTPAFAPWLGEVTVENLRELLQAELGDARALDDFQPRGPRHFSKAVAPRTILHIVSGNTPHAGLQSLFRGLLLGSHNWVKLPTGGLPEIAAFRDALPAELAARVELAETLPEEWLGRAEAVIVFGADATIEEFRRRTQAGQIFVAHGHRVSFGVVCDADAEAARAAARDASLFDQRGCQSPHLFYVQGGAARVLGWAAALAREMEIFNQTQPRAKLAPADAARIYTLREEWRFRATGAAGEAAVWTSAGSTDWTVIGDVRDSAFVASPADRVVFVKPLPEPLAALPAALGPARRHLGAVGFWPATVAHGRELAALDLPAARLCPIGRMQTPPLTWHQDGLPPLGALVRWVDLETL